MKTKQEKKGAQLNLIVPENIKRAFKSTAAQMGLTLQDAGLKALQDFLERKGKQAGFNSPPDLRLAAI